MVGNITVNEVDEQAMLEIISGESLEVIRAFEAFCASHA
jgi:hypothetical protein